MKKIYFCLFLGASTFGQAQTTLQGADVNATVGEAFSLQRTDWVSEGPAGANQSWDFSGVTVTGMNTLSYTAANAAFAETNITQNEGGAGNHMKLDATGQYVHGQYSGTIVLTYSNPLTYLEFPLSMGLSGNDTHACTFSSSGLSFVRSGTSTWEIDAWGTVKTPVTTYTNVLRVKQTLIYTDTYAGGTIDYESTIYSWYKAGIHVPVFSLTSLTSDIVSNDWGTYYAGIADVSELNAQNFQVYPNPTSDLLNVKTTGNIKSIVVTDISGKVLRESVSGEQVDLTELNDGVYFVSLILMDGTRTRTQKVVKN